MKKDIKPSMIMHSEHDTLAQCWVDDGPTPKTAGQH